MKSFSAIFVAFLCFSCLSGDDFWVEKPYPEWDRKECEKLLADSPWSYPYAITGVSIPGMMNFSTSRVTEGRSFGEESLDTVTGDREVHLYLQVRFLTAKPMKAAVGRMRMLSQPDNSDLSSQVAQYVNQPDGPEIAVELTWYSEPSGHWALREIEGFLRKSTLAAIQNKTWLSGSSGDTRVPVLRYQGPSETYPGALLFFSRHDEEGNPNFSDTEGDILFHMETEFGLVDLILHPDKMTFEEKFTF